MDLSAAPWTCQHHRPNAPLRNPASQPSSSSAENSLFDPLLMSYFPPNLLLQCQDLIPQKTLTSLLQTAITPTGRTIFPPSISTNDRLTQVFVIDEAAALLLPLHFFILPFIISPSFATTQSHLLQRRYGATLTIGDLLDFLMHKAAFTFKAGPLNFFFIKRRTALELLSHSFYSAIILQTICKGRIPVSSLTEKEKAALEVELATFHAESPHDLRIPFYAFAICIGSLNCYSCKHWACGLLLSIVRALPEVGIQQIVDFALPFFKNAVITGPSHLHIDLLLQAGPGPWFRHLRGQARGVDRQYALGPSIPRDPLYEEAPLSPSLVLRSSLGETATFKFGLEIASPSNASQEATWQDTCPESSPGAN